MQPILAANAGPSNPGAVGGASGGSGGPGGDKKRGRGQVSYREDATLEGEDEETDEEAEAERKRKKKGKDSTRIAREAAAAAAAAAAAVQATLASKDEKSSWLGEIPPGEAVVIKVAGRTKHAYLFVSRRVSFIFACSLLRSRCFLLPAFFLLTYQP